MAKSTRKCKICKNEFDIVKNDYIRFKNGFCEIDCYKEYKLNKGMDEEILDKQIDELMKLTKEEKIKRSQEELEKTKKKIRAKKKEDNRKKNLDNLINYFSDIYDIRIFSKYFYTKLAQINNGSYKGLKDGIPYADILDMFKIKQQSLNSIAERNKSKGKEITGINRLNYDLAILINKYDDYLSWKNKQKVIENQVQVKHTSNELKIDYSKLCSNSKKENNNDDIDINDICDDIY